jgi:hypothetical protein
MTHRFDCAVSRRMALMLMSAFVAILATGPMLRAVAAEPAAATAERPMLDPWVPPEARKPAMSPPTRGAALREQVERKLKQGFDSADVDRTGTLTREQANAAGLGYIAKHFDEIDRQKAGAVRFEDVKRFLRERGAQLN